MFAGTSSSPVPSAINCSWCSHPASAHEGTTRTRVSQLPGWCDDRPRVRPTPTLDALVVAAADDQPRRRKIVDDLAEQRHPARNERGASAGRSGIEEGGAALGHADWVPPAGRQDPVELFLGWTSHGGHDYHVRQFRDMKGTVNLDMMTARGLATYATVCGRTLARAHVRSGDSALIAGYLGRRDRFDRAVASFAQAYADQFERDYETLIEAVKTGRVQASPMITARSPDSCPLS
jgi:hypothetical protein